MWGQQGGQHGQGGARAGKDRAGGSSTGALCTRFTLVLIEHFVILKQFIKTLIYNYTFAKVVIRNHIKINIIILNQFF
jgi:hypothetical protein